MSEGEEAMTYRATINALAKKRLTQDPDTTVLRYLDGSSWRGLTWRETRDATIRAAKSLEEMGVERGTPVAVLAETRWEWLAADLAILARGGITVGIYPTLLPEQVKYELSHSEAEVLIIESEQQRERIAGVLEDLPQLRHVVDLTDIIEREGAAPSDDEIDAFWEAVELIGPEDVATYIYTSGTTGPPKAVVLTHGNIHEVVMASRDGMPVYPGDTSIIFLPMAHILQRFVLYRGLVEDANAVVAPSLNRLPETFLEARPQVVATVPRMLEKIREGVEQKIGQQRPLVRGIYHAACGIGRAHSRALQAGRRPGPLLGLGWSIADRLVYSKIKNRLGGRLRWFISGGAPLDPELATWFHGMGIPILEGWGLSETTAPLCMSQPEDLRIGTVGRPLPGSEVRITDDGEVEARGPGLFQEYLKDPDATSAAFTDDGWFKTGDLGTVDSSGFLRIIGRKKDILITAAGKNVAPINIEQRLERARCVARAVAVGDRRPYLVALLEPDVEWLEAAAGRKGWPDDRADLLAHPEVVALFDLAVEKANAGLARFEQIKTWALLPDPLSEPLGTLTTTLKVRRQAVYERYAELVDGLYEKGSTEPDRKTSGKLAKVEKMATAMWQLAFG